MPALVFHLGVPNRCHIIVRPFTSVATCSERHTVCGSTPDVGSGSADGCQRFIRKVLVVKIMNAVLPTYESKITMALDTHMPCCFANSGLPWTLLKAQGNDRSVDLHNLLPAVRRHCGGYSNLKAYSTYTVPELRKYHRALSYTDSEISGDRSARYFTRQAMQNLRWKLKVAKPSIERTWRQVLVKSKF
nr:hypothetical protein CFP56_03678 [Quercus suber]